MHKENTFTFKIFNIRIKHKRMTYEPRDRPSSGSYTTESKLKTEHLDPIAFDAYKGKPISLARQESGLGGCPFLCPATRVPPAWEGMWPDIDPHCAALPAQVRHS